MGVGRANAVAAAVPAGDGMTGAAQGRGEAEYVLLCRHARHDNGVLRKKDGGDKSSGNPEFDYPTHDVAHALREELLYGRQIRLGCILYAPTPESSATAGLLRDGLAGRDSHRLPDRDPFKGDSRDTFTIEITSMERDGEIHYDHQFYACKCADLNPAMPRTADTVVRAQCQIAASLEKVSDAKSNAVLVVGHQPQLSWLSDQLTAGHGWRIWRRLQWWSTGPVPITHGEIVCLRIEKRQPAIRKWSGHMLWSIHPDDSKRLADIREKVQSKLKSAELLASVLGLALTAVIALLLDRSRWQGLAMDGEEPRPPVTPFGQDWLSFEPRTGVQVAVIMFIAALAMYLMTVYAYDSLRMPPEFWSEASLSKSSDSQRLRRRWLPRRPPSSSAWVLYRNMMRIWGLLFVPATALVLTGFVTLAVSLLDWGATAQAWILAAVLAIAMLVWRSLTRPVLGSED